MLAGDTESGPILADERINQDTGSQPLIAGLVTAGLHGYVGRRPAGGYRAVWDYLHGVAFYGFAEITGGPSSDEYLFRHEFVPAADAGTVRLVDSAFVAAMREGWVVMIGEVNTTRGGAGGRLLLGDRGSGADDGA